MNVDLHLTPEDRLLLSLLASTNRREKERPDLPGSRGFSWTRFKKRAVAWGLAPLASRGLKRSGLSDRVPADIATHFEAIRRSTAVRNSLVLHRLKEILAELGRQRLEVLVLKGGDLMLTAYPDLSLRIVMDLDLLCRPGDVDAVESTLRDLGYAEAMNVGREWFDENLHHGLPWVSADRFLTIEVHWALVRPADPFRFDMDGLWRRARPLEQPGGRPATSSEAPEPGAFRLSVSDHLEYLAAHFFRHLTTPDGALRNVADAFMLLDTGEGRRLDWTRLNARAEDQGTLLPLCLLLRMMALADPDGEWPARAREIEARLGDPTLADAAWDLARGIFRMPSNQPTAIVSGFTRLGEAPGLSGKARFVLAGLFPRARHINRDLSPAQARWPLALRYPALALNYAREMAAAGPRALLGAYRLGRVRQGLRSSAARRPRTAPSVSGDSPSPDRRD